MSGDGSAFQIFTPADGAADNSESVVRIVLGFAMFLGIAMVVGTFVYLIRTNWKTYKFEYKKDKLETLLKDIQKDMRDIDNALEGANPYTHAYTQLKLEKCYIYNRLDLKRAIDGYNAAYADTGFDYALSAELDSIVDDVNMCYRDYKKIGDEGSGEVAVANDIARALNYMENMSHVGKIIDTMKLAKSVGDTYLEGILTSELQIIADAVGLTSRFDSYNTTYGDTTATTDEERIFGNSQYIRMRIKSMSKRLPYIADIMTALSKTPRATLTRQCELLVETIVHKLQTYEVTAAMLLADDPFSIDVRLRAAGEVSTDILSYFNSPMFARSKYLEIRLYHMFAMDQTHVEKIKDAVGYAGVPPDPDTAPAPTPTPPPPVGPIGPTPRI